MKKMIVEVGAIIRDSRHIHAHPVHLVIENGRILDILDGKYEGDTTNIEWIQRPHALAIPGLVNSHGHAAMTLLRGAGDDMPLMTWLNERIFPLENQLTADAIFWGTQLACWEMIQSGTTCFTDMYMFMHDAARAVEQAGMRAILSWGAVGFDAENRQRGLNNTRSFVTQWQGQAEGRITTTVAPHAPYTCPPDFLEELAELSLELNVPIQIHLSETQEELQNSIQVHQMTPIELLKKIGLLHRPILAAHCVHVTEEDIQILKEYQVKVAHNPQSNLKLGSGVAPIVRMNQVGICVGLGTDGAASNNNLDMFEELRLAATLHKGILMDATALPANEAFDMATLKSAECCFLEPGHGTLHPGMMADFVLLDLQSSHFLPTYDFLSNVVYAAGADDVTDVFIQGKQVLNQRNPTTLDIERIRYEVKRIQSTLKFKQLTP